MLENTFLHLPGLSEPSERMLWEQGCLDWRCLLDGLHTYSIGSASRSLVEKELVESLRAHESKNHQYFESALKMKDAWRAFEAFRHSCAYVDIETDGGQSGSSITTIGLYDGESFQIFVKNDNLESFRDAISRYSMIVTFYGGTFDLPMLQKRFPGHAFDQIHLDLCVALRRVGIRGGLKKIEKEFGIQRGADTDGLSGYDAIRLWRRWEMFHDRKALDTLIAYNREDVVNLETLAEIAFKRLQTEFCGEYLKQRDQGRLALLDA